jgi:hypothetical protein
MWICPSYKYDTSGVSVGRCRKTHFIGHMKLEATLPSRCMLIEYEMAMLSTSHLQLSNPKGKEGSRFIFTYEFTKLCS